MAGAMRLVVSSDLDTVKLIARAVRAICQDRLDTDELDAVEMALVEAVTNVIKHGYHGKSDESLAVGVALHQDRIVIEVEDTATPLDPSLLEQPTGDRFTFDHGDIEALPEGGMGIALIQMSMDDVTYVRDGQRNLLRMTKKLQNRSDA
jgi:serine/threonine-protein kinase RsbW